MGELTGIAWTDSTFNPWWGCTEVSPGCDHCYAREWAAFTRKMEWGKGAPRIRTGIHNWNEPRRWNKAAAAEGRMHKVFCASMADVMDGEVDPAWRADLWNLVADTPNLIWQFLTKRPDNYHRWVREDIRLLPNIWWGTTCENQEQWYARWPTLASFNSAGLRWVSYEPAIGPLVMRAARRWPDWVVVGGESGEERRPFDPQWAKDVLHRCRLLGIPFFMKQMSARTSKEAVALIPPHLFVRQFPKEKTTHGSSIRTEEAAVK